MDWDVDIDVVVNPISYPSLVVRELYKDEVALFYRAGAPRRLLLNPELFQTKSILQRLRGFDKVTRNGMTSDSLELLVKLTSLGLGYGILPETIAKSDRRLKKWKEGPSYADRICLIYSKKKHRNEVSRFIIEAHIEGARKNHKIKDK